MDSAGAKSAMSNDMQELTQGKEDTGNQIRGHKANLSNPNTSEESKQTSKQALKELGGDDTLEDRRNNPVSKNASETLYGGRATAG
ncbi:hypothetical protein CHGG_07481 [Chaetomium globosum CBS 148.51]|uniref:Conidiation protein 6 n=1 Tax=Chaetomium globosum (strain ATCC 6205 / CBS 148.51 / DSM 1962 / NBRC 6347 / NRRL 1970) TaxID=306901 RepID=Q2GX23_CHAGB|nr:uncharacterized protein CHGG_07481 [Chaetomium globosum CBS 148.51]EAQ86228.1 hypothetical protein CHGG_07481 [Chaetomium globosum CBS 148.51]